MQNNPKTGNGKMEEALAHIEFQGGEEDPISEVVRQGLEQYLAGEEIYAASERAAAAPRARNDDGENAPGAEQCAPPAQSSEPAAANPTMVVNISEQVVRKKVLQAMEQAGGCTCAHCISDAVALALNSLTPQYMVAHQQEILARMEVYEREYEAKITGAVVSACLKVTGHPRH